jgi:RNA polymerase sigma factor (sigma-70 family)
LPSPTSESGRFATTRWSLVCTAAGTASGPQAMALEELCQAYWSPLYAWLRRTGRNPVDAQDLVQAFFARLLTRGLLGRAERERGRFRSFLLVSLKNYLADEHDRATALKRGGGIVEVPWDIEDAEAGYLAGDGEPLAPDALFERRWALAVLDRALEALRAEYVERGRERVFDGLKDHVWGDPGTVTISEASGAVGLTESAARVAVHRLRGRFAEILRAHIADTLADDTEVDTELRHLVAILGG